MIGKKKTDKNIDRSLCKRKAMAIPSNAGKKKGGRILNEAMTLAKQIGISQRKI